MKKYTSGSFTATKYAIYKEDTDIITSFPTEIIADGENASATVYGNMVQSGTPTPTTPITPSECGDLETTGTYSGQYKIPISSANTTTDIYFGEVQTTRIIKKLVLDGTENWSKSTAQTGRYNLAISDYLKARGEITSICTHFNAVAQQTGGQYPDNTQSFYAGSDATVVLYIHDSSLDTLADFKSYLADQYTNGTPVIVWYVLATPTTGILNEPLRKIGEYADTVIATIPTIAAAENINVTTILKPSAVDLTYTGWHKNDDKKRSGGAWV